jgi:hypothetical protein
MAEDFGTMDWVNQAAIHEKQQRGICFWLHLLDARAGRDRLLDVKGIYRKRIAVANTRNRFHAAQSNRAVRPR